VQKITSVLRKINKLLKLLNIKNCCHHSCTFLTAICTKSFVGWGFAPDLTGGAYSAPTDPLAVFRRPTSKGTARERRRG